MARRNNGPKLKWLNKRNTWYITWTEDGRSREHSTRTKDRNEAEIYFADWIRQYRKEFTRWEPEEILITDLLSEYAKERIPKVKDGQRIVYALIPLIEFWSGKSVEKITRQTCEAYSEFRLRSVGTVRRELTTLRAAINHAFAEGRLTRTKKVHLPDRPEPKDRWLTKGEAARLLNAARARQKSRSYLPLFMLIGLHSGARKEAILTLKWSQVNLDAGTIHWNPEGREQTKKRRPRTRIPRKLVGHLRRAKKESEESEYVINRSGSPIKDIKSSFKAASREAGLSDVSPHVLRHTRATWGMKAGAPIWELAAFLGMTIETLQKVYAHHHPDFQKVAAETY